MSCTVGRNPFARGEYRRFTLSNIGTFHKCASCGRVPFRLYSYLWCADDAPKPSDGKGKLFCNLKCHKTYHP